MELGTTHGSYEVLSRVASGGMATIYLAKSHVDASLVALKRLHPQYARDGAFSAMFVDEARVMSCLRHPNIVRMVDVLSTQNELVLVMEYIDGAPLGRLRHHLAAASVGVIARVVHDVLLGLQHAHEATDEYGHALGIVHRDVSPQNVLVGKDGVTRVLDFGVAKVDRSYHRTSTGEVRGKIPYMSPEQLMGERVEPSSDVWATGVVLWELLTGRRLFTGHQVAVVAQISHGPILPPSVAAPDRDISLALDRVVMRALDRDRANRYPTAAAMAAALEDAIALSDRRTVATWVRENAPVVDDAPPASGDVLAAVLTQAATPAARRITIPPEPLLAAMPRRGMSARTIAIAMAAVALLASVTHLTSRTHAATSSQTVAEH